MRGFPLRSRIAIKLAMGARTIVDELEMKAACVDNRSPGFLVHRLEHNGRNKPFLGLLPSLTSLFTLTKEQSEPLPSLLSASVTRVFHLPISSHS